MATKKAAKKAAKTAVKSAKAPKSRPAPAKAAPKPAPKPASKPPAKAVPRVAPRAVPKAAPPKKAAKAKPAAPSPPPKPAAKGPPARNGSSAERQQAELYAVAVEAFQAGKFKRAIDQFEAVAAGPDAGLRHRAQVHIRICRQRTESDTVELATAEDYYNYAIKLINDRRLDEADKHLDQALKKASGAGYVHYAKAIVAALRRNGDDAFRSLSRAIDLDPKHRLLARRDPDMAGVRDDARIADLLQGDVSGAD